MTDSNEATGKRSRHGFWFGLAAGGILGVALSGAVALGAGALAAGHLGGGHGHRGFFRHEDPEAAREHVALATDWILTRVEATEDQKGQAKRIVAQIVRRPDASHRGASVEPRDSRRGDEPGEPRPRSDRAIEAGPGGAIRPGVEGAQRVADGARGDTHSRAESGARLDGAQIP